MLLNKWVLFPILLKIKSTDRKSVWGFLLLYYKKVDNSLVKEGKRILPDIWCVSRDVELCSRIKVHFGSLGARADSLILCPFTRKRSLKTHSMS